MSQSKILTPSEVRQWAKLDSYFPLCDLADIYDILWLEFKNCLGLSFLKDVKADLADYSDVSEWNFETTYNLGDIVKYKKVVFTAVTENTNSVPSSVNDCWDFAPKFKTPCFNELWCEGSLARFISLVVAKTSITPSAIKLNAQGAVKHTTEGQESASRQERHDLIAHFDARAAVSLDRLIEFIQTYEGDCFKNSKLIHKDCCNKCSYVKPDDCKCVDDCTDGRLSQWYGAAG